MDFFLVSNKLCDWKKQDLFQLLPVLQFLEDEVRFKSLFSPSCAEMHFANNF